MNYCGIYKITNVVTGDFYIGSAVNLRMRYQDHRSRLIGNRHANVHLQRAWNKYGADSFEFSVCEHCEKDRTIEREQFYIDNEKPTYNILPIAGSRLGSKASDEARQHMSIAHIGVRQTEETKRKRSEALKGKPNGKLGTRASDETKRKMSESHANFCHTEEGKRKISEAQMGELNHMFGKHQSEEARAKMSEARKSNTYALGYHHTEEAKRKISETLKRRYMEISNG